MAGIGSSSSSASQQYSSSVQPALRNGPVRRFSSRRWSAGQVGDAGGGVSTGAAFSGAAGWGDGCPAATADRDGGRLRPSSAARRRSSSISRPLARTVALTGRVPIGKFGELHGNRLGVDPGMPAPFGVDFPGDSVEAVRGAVVGQLGVGESAHRVASALAAPVGVEAAPFRAGRRWSAGRRPPRHRARGSACTWESAPCPGSAGWRSSCRSGPRRALRAGCRRRFATARR